MNSVESFEVGLSGFFPSPISQPYIYRTLYAIFHCALGFLLALALLIIGQSVVGVTLPEELSGMMNHLPSTFFFFTSSSFVY